MKKFVLLAAGLLLSFLAQAQVLQVKGVGTQSYAGVLAPEVKEKAYVKAQMAAIERYVAENGEAEARNFEAIQERIEENLDKFIISTTVISEQDQTTLHKYSVVVRVELNLAKLRNTLSASSAVSKASDAAKSQLVYLFVGREAASVRSFDAKVFKRAEAETTVAGSAKGSQRVTAQLETGGSTTQKADEVAFRLLPIANVTSSITSVFSQGGFLVVDPAYAIGDKDFKSVNKDFSAGNDLAPATMRSVVATLKKAQIPLLVLATLDVGPPSQDPATGMARVAVSISGRVLDLRNAMPLEIASVPAVQYFGIAPDNLTARDKGLKEAALAAAREAVSRLNARGIQ